MSLDQAVAFFLFVLVAAGSPGPANVLVAANAARVGVVRGIPCLLGVSVGTGLLVGTVAFGLGAIVLQYPAVALVMKLAGAAWLLWLAYKIATAPVGHSASNEPDTGVGFLTAFALQWVNPKSWTVAASAAAAYLQADAAPAWVQALALTGLFIAGATPAVGAWLLFGGAMRNMLGNESAHQRFNLAMGCLLAASVVLIFA